MNAELLINLRAVPLNRPLGNAGGARHLRVGPSGGKGTQNILFAFAQTVDRRPNVGGAAQARTVHGIAVYGRCNGGEEFFVVNGLQEKVGRAFLEALNRQGGYI